MNCMVYKILIKKVMEEIEGIDIPDIAEYIGYSVRVIMILQSREEEWWLLHRTPCRKEKK